jgi:hypothetical protein
MSTAYDERRSEDRRPEEIEDDIERTRSQIGGTLEELERRLSPDRLADQLVGYLRGPNEFGANLARQVKANPIPVALIGIGVAWLLLAGRDDARSPRYYARRSPRATALPDEGDPYDEYDEYEAYDEYAAANAYAVVGRPYDDPYRTYDDPDEEGSYDADGVYRGYRETYEDRDVAVGRPREAATPASVYDEEERTATDPLTTGEPATTRTTTTEQRPLTGGRAGT